MRRRIKKNLRLALEVAALCRRIVPAWKISYIKAFRRGMRACRQGRFDPAAAFRLGLFNPAVEREEYRRYVSHGRLYRAQKVLNPSDWEPLARNKEIFYRYCNAVGLPVPSVCAVVYGSGAVWSSSSGEVDGPDAWRRMLSDGAFDEFVAKPSIGAHGLGFNVFARTADGFTDGHGECHSPEALRDALAPLVRGNATILQQRLKNHPELVRLSGSEVLQTVRMFTLLERGGSCRILGAYLKTAQRGRLVDNFGGWAVGNIQSTVRLEDGVLVASSRITPDGNGIISLTHHSDTGVRLNGVRLPFWSRARELVCRTAPLFRPLRTIGWDVALTPDGPVIVEGNVRWEPSNQHGDMLEIFETLRRAAEEGQA